MDRCNGCVYENFRRMKDPTNIQPNSVVIVGEAPGSMEVVKGVPFIGPSGDLLERSCALVGLPSFRSMYITNVMMCRPPAGVIKKDAIFRCAPRLQAELKAVNPKLIIVLGTVALQAVMGDSSLKITQCHGVTLNWNGSTVIPALHPAAILRAPGEYKSFVSDLFKGKQLLDGVKMYDAGSPEYYVPQSLYEVQRAMEYLIRRGIRQKNFIVGADIETGDKNRILCLGICYQKNCVIIFKEEFIPFLAPLLSSQYIKFCWHNGQYDTSYLWWMKLLARIDHDCILLQYCLNEHEGDKALELLATRYLGIQNYKNVPKNYTKKGDVGYESVPTSVLWPYLAKDCDYTFQIAYILGPKVERDPDLKKLYYNLLIPASNFLRRVSSNGLYPNYGYIEQLREDFIQEEERLEDRIMDAVQHLWNPEEYKQATGAQTAKDMFKPSSPKQLKYMLFTKMGLVNKTRKKGSTDKEVLKSLEGKHPVIPLLLDLRSAAKTRGTYIDGTLKRVGADGRVHSFFTLYKTVTGRLSSRNPNLQNIPRESKIKQIFCAAPGNALIEADYKGAELRVLAYLSGDKALTQVFVDGRDPHVEVAIELYGKDFTDDQKIRAKAVNFGIAYGRTEFSLAREYNISLNEALAMIDKWSHMYPQAWQYLLQCDEDARTGKVLVTPFGRKRRFGLITQEKLNELENEARNFRVQNIASDLNLLSGMDMEIGLSLHNYMLVNLVHDSIVAEGPFDLDLIRACCEHMKSVMSASPKKYLGTSIPFVADVKIGHTWGALTKEKDFWKELE